MDFFKLKDIELTIEQEIEVEDLVIKIMDLFNNQNLIVCFETLDICINMLDEIEKDLISSENS